MNDIPKTKYGLSFFRNPDDSIHEVGIDEAGKGPMFGRVYAAAVILPKTRDFDCDNVRDSKKIKSLKNLRQLSDLIKENAIAWSVCYEDESAKPGELLKTRAEKATER